VLFFFFLFILMLIGEPFFFFFPPKSWMVIGECVNKIFYLDRCFWHRNVLALAKFALDFGAVHFIP
jgi:hypothetical protein